MDLKKIIYRREGLLKGEKKKIFVCELSEEEYVEWVNTHKAKTQTEVLLEGNGETK